MIDDELQVRAREYARTKHRLLAFELALVVLSFGFVLFSGLSVWFRNVVLNITPDPWLSTLIYFIVGMIGYGLLFLPISFYSGYVLPHRYELSTQTLGGWFSDMFKGGVLSLMLGAVIIEVVYFLLRTTPEWWWLISAVFMVLFSVLLAALTPVLILPLFFKFTPLQDPELVERLMTLAKQAKTRVNGVYTMVMSDRTNAANAAFMGIGGTKRIVLGDTLYANFTKDEIETIMAHELAHQVHNDIYWGIAVQSVLLLVVFYLGNLLMVAGVAFFGFQGIADLAAMPLLGLVMGGLLLLTTPLGNWYSRWREVAADRYALETTRNPEAFISAFEKLANQNLAQVEPEPWVEWLLYDHPSIAKRVAMGHAFQTPA